MTSPILTPAAEADLASMWSYYYERSPAAAEQWLSTLEAAIRRLGDLPELGHLRPDLTERPVKFFTTRGTTIIYRPDTAPIYILRIAGQGRDLGSLLE